jgi:LmbE family N-acetylglucosaminyl deacetylase
MSDLRVHSLGKPILVIAPHPDDETLGCGGLIAQASRAGIEVHTMFVTDGSASHPRSRRWPAKVLAKIRMEEAKEALRRLGAENQPRTFLELRDGRMPVPESCQYRKAVDAAAQIVARSGTRTLVAPWRRDAHTDHRLSWQIGRDAMLSARVAFTMLEYAIWLPENGKPSDWPTMGEVDEAMLDICDVLELKRHAIEAHQSQLGKIIDDDLSGFCLSSQTLSRLITRSERYWVSRWLDP